MFCAGSNLAPSMSVICHSENLWQWSRLQIRTHTFRRTTILQKQFIIIIVIVIINLCHKELHLRYSRVPVYISSRLLYFKVMFECLMRSDENISWRITKFICQVCKCNKKFVAYFLTQLLSIFAQTRIFEKWEGSIPCKSWPIFPLIHHI